MKSSKGTAFSGLKLLMGGASMVALTAMAVMSTPVVAQETAPAASGDGDVVVVGVRRALKTAQQIKRDADTVVDSITANDIGSFPDKSVAEALQRVAGITVNRFAASDDTAHFSAEPSGVVVRGLQQVRSEFNGRDIFTADSNRGLSWSDVSPELMGGVDVYKNQTAELIEGGIAGTVNLRTRLPFDQKGRVLAATASYTTGDLINKGSPTYSGIWSDRWETELGEFGLMANFAHSQVLTNSQGIQFGRYAAVVSAALGSTGAATWDNPTKKYLPGSASLRNNKYDRTRDGVSLAGQWQSTDRSMTATLQYNQSKKTELMEERVYTFGSGTDSWAQPLTWVSDGTNGTRCVGGASACTYNAEGGLLKGTLVRDINAWMGGVGAQANATDPSGGYNCYSWTCSEGGVRGTDFTSASRYAESENDTKDIGFNFKWKVSDKLSLNFDVQQVDATQTNYDIEAALRSYANVSYDLTGDHPTFNLAAPSSFNDSPGGVTNPQNFSARHIMDHITDSEGDMFATRADLVYSFDSPWLNTLKAGVRFADRKQTVRWSTYNWKNIVDDWSGYTANNYFITGSVFPAGGYEMASIGNNFYTGDATNVTSVPFFTMSAIKDRKKFAATFGNQVYNPLDTNTPPTGSEWIPICYRAGEDSKCFRAAELSDVEEKTNAAYVQLKFGGDDATIFGGISVTGNIGVRYVETQNISTGGVNYPTMVYSTTPTSSQEVPPGSGNFQTVYNWSYFIQAADRAFLTPSTQKATFDITHKNWLPSFNIRLKFTDKWYLRAAASRALSRPDIGNLKAYASVGTSFPSTADQICGKAFTCTAGVPTAAVMTYTGSSQNPLLKPVTADQFDISLENYFSSTGSVTLNVFYKKFYDYIQFGSSYRTFTNNGVSREVLMNGPVNGDGASIKGFELAYQRFFDFLPAPFDGFGVQANYTYLENTGIGGAGVKKETADDNGSSDPGIGGVSRSDNSFLNLPLEQLSDNSANLVLMYEKGQWSARAAYNWRSEFMVTAQDCCTTFPVFQEDAGYLDARLAYRFNEQVEVSIEGNNLLNTETVLMQMVDGPTVTFPTRSARFLKSSWFQNDRRIQASIRLKF